ncbi:N-acetyltransferase [Alteromonadaceae bacterium M269]|nr:N-acetyltransferase [Alteromonadaceae bacterium M269]
MPVPSFTLKQRPPSASDLAELRALIGWRNPELELIEQSIEQSLFWVTAYQGNHLVAAGRVIGDSSMYFYVQDVIVHPKHQGLGLGQRIMESIEAFLSSTCQSGATVGLLSVKGKEGFYERFGYSVREGESLGFGMCKFL